MSVALAPTEAGDARLARPAVAVVVMQHVEESAHLRQVRSRLVRAPHVRLLQLGRIDERIAAHLDGVATAGAQGALLARQALERPDAGALFVATVRAIEVRDDRALDRLLAIAEALPAARAGLLSAFGWVAAPCLQGITKGLLASTSPWWREVGLAACAMHGIDPGASLLKAIRDRDPGLRARALRGAGRGGRIDLQEDCLACLADEAPRCAFEAACAASLLGDRTESLATLRTLAASRDPHDLRAIVAARLLLKIMPVNDAHAMLSVLANEAGLVRRLIEAVAMAGDPRYVPWLIGHMEDMKLARLAGEAFSLMTGLDLAYLDLERKPPPNAASGPSDDPADEVVAMDEDDGLPWPDPGKLRAWWQSNAARFAVGTRYFMGQVPTPAHCAQVLASGFQRQRHAAAEYLTLMAPGTPLFDVRAPAWRQRRSLKKQVEVI